nr:hypothetical protein [Tanacetum cinerariifolium]
MIFSYKSTSYTDLYTIGSQQKSHSVDYLEQTRLQDSCKGSQVGAQTLGVDQVNSSCGLTRTNSASFETRLRFVSRRWCILPKKTSCVLLKDIQCAGSDTRPPMLDRTDFASWQQRIRLYCRGKDNRVNILKSIDEGPYILGTFRETLAESTEETPQFGLERSRVYSDLNSNERDRYNADIQATNILLQGSELTKEDRESRLYDDFEHFKQHKEESIND